MTDPCLACSPTDQLGGRVFLLRRGRRHWVSIEWVRENGFRLPDDVHVVPDAALLNFLPGQPAPRSWTREQFCSVTPTTVGEARELAASQVRGRGLEVGAGASPFPVPLSCEIEYADAYGYEDLLRNRYAGQDEHEFVAPTHKAELDNLQSIANEAYDFVVACHVIEHARDPIGAIKSAFSKLRPGGSLVLVIPDMTLTFDRDRAVTPLEHLVLDYRDPSRDRDSEHYRDFYQNALGFSDDRENFETIWRKKRDEAYSIHFHTWTYDSFREMIDWTTANVVPFKIDWCHPAVVGGIEFYVTLVK